MPTLINQGTLRFTPEGGTQSVVVSNSTSTDFQVTYGLQLAHGASPENFVVGDTIRYAVVLENTGSGALSGATVTVDLANGQLNYVAGSAVAFLYDGTDVTDFPVTVTQGSVIFTFPEEIPGGNTVFLVYDAVVNNTAGDVVVSTATGTATDGAGDTLADSDTATITATPISIVKTAPASAEIGETIQYGFTITNNTGSAIVLDDLVDQLPTNFSFTGITLTLAGTPVPLTEGVDYTVSAEGLLTLAPAAVQTLPAGAVAAVVITGVVTA